MRKLKAADLFCGAGGTSQGAKQSGVAEVRFALNHWQTAVDTHLANFPAAKHVNSTLETTKPAEAEPFDILFASPECTHHSRARGDRPTSDQQRSGAWHTLPWIEHHRPSFFTFENVIEFQEWGPVGTNGKPLEKFKGKFFDSWLMALQSAGYRLEVIRLNAADFGAATSRERLFVIGRKGNRRPRLPEPTHSRLQGTALPGMERPGWRPTLDIIDWSIPLHSIFTRKRPLKDSTLLRLDAGLRKFAGPFVVRYRNNMDASSLGLPLGTITAGGGHHGLAIPILVHTNHDDQRTASIQKPLGTITTKNGMAIALPFISSYYGNDSGCRLTDPVPTIVTKDRHALIVGQVGLHNDSQQARTEAERRLRDTMRELGICDIFFRMFQNNELAAAQGFPPDYIFCGGKADITKQIGNSVSPVVAEAITYALAG